MTKKGQVSSQAVFYVLAIILFALVLLGGYKAFMSMKDKNSRMVMVEFRIQFAKDLKSVSLHYDNSKYSEYPPPDGVDEICFVDLEKIRDDDLVSQPILRDSFRSNNKANMFLLGKDIEAVYIEGIKIQKPPYYTCFEPEGDVMKIKFLGTGDGAYVFPPPNKEYCRSAEDLNICAGLNLVFDTDYQNRCCEIYTICC